MKLEQSLREAASSFESRLDGLADRHVARQREEIAEFRDTEAPEVWEEIRRITRESRRAQAVHLRAGRTLPGSCPVSDTEAAQLAARNGVTLTSVLQSYRIGHFLTWEAWLDAIDDLSISEPERKACMRAISRFVTSYDDRIAGLVAREYESIREMDAGTMDSRRLRSIRNLLEGLSDEEDTLGYDLGVEHVGVVAWGRDARDALRELEGITDRRLLWAPWGDKMLTGWLGSRSRLSHHDQRALADFPSPGDSCVAVGQPAAGIEGFRRTHRQAGDAYVVARRLGRRVTLYEDVRPEALALRDAPAARDMVTSALADLAGDDARSQDLRRTLRAYFAVAHNAASAAAALGVHEHTVARRIQVIEERIGSSVNSRRAELELALRLEPLLWPSGSAA